VGEIFIRMAKEGSAVSGLMDSFATAISLALQYGVPLQVLVDKFSHTRFEPSGITRNPEIPIAKSIMDYLFRWLQLRFCRDTNADGEDISGSDFPRVTIQTTSSIPPLPAGFADSIMPPGFHTEVDAPFCPDCGSIMVRSGACHRCINCGSTSGCS
jgi:ribonucleoside-diphosphate reductase alpha chain